MVAVTTRNGVMLQQLTRLFPLLLYSRNGKPIYAPEHFMDALPINICLDGELFAGRQEFQSLMSIKSNPHDERWSQVCYLVYDAPLTPGPFPVHLQALRRALSTVPSNIAKVLEQV
jgi:ATP-dependent DNA ligase